MGLTCPLGQAHAKAAFAQRRLNPDEVQEVGHNSSFDLLVHERRCVQSRAGVELEQPGVQISVQENVHPEELKAAAQVVEQLQLVARNGISIALGANHSLDDNILGGREGGRKGGNGEDQWGWKRKREATLAQLIRHVRRPNLQSLPDSRRRACSKIRIQILPQCFQAPLVRRRWLFRWARWAVFAPPRLN